MQSAHVTVLVANGATGRVQPSTGGAKVPVRFDRLDAWVWVPLHWLEPI